MSANNIPKWIKEGKKFNDENPKDAFVQIPEGETSYTIDVSVPPTKRPSKYKREDGTHPDKYIFTLMDGKKLSVPEGLQREIIEVLYNGTNKIAITRIGKSNDTRYKCRAVVSTA